MVMWNGINALFRWKKREQIQLLVTGRLQYQAFGRTVGLVVESAQSGSGWPLCVCVRAAGDALLVDCMSLSGFALLLGSISVWICVHVQIVFSVWASLIFWIRVGCIVVLLFELVFMLTCVYRVWVSVSLLIRVAARVMLLFS